MADVIVHTIPGSPYARAVMATLEEKRVSWRIAALQPGEHRQQGHLARHPFGRVPALEHDGFVLYETQAILRYLDRMWPNAPMTPVDPKIAARMDQVMNITDWYLFQGCAATIGFQRVIGPKLLGITPDEAAIASAMPRAHLVFDELSRFIADQAFIAGNQLSLADMMVVPQLDFMAQTPEWQALTDGRTNVVDYLSRTAVRPSFAATTWERVAALAAAG